MSACFCSISFTGWPAEGEPTRSAQMSILSETNPKPHTQAQTETDTDTTAETNTTTETNTTQTETTTDMRWQDINNMLNGEGDLVITREHRIPPQFTYNIKIALGFFQVCFLC